LKSIDLFIFDLDGTLIDSSKDIAASANYALAQLQLMELPDDTIKQFVGDGVRILLSRCLEMRNGLTDANLQLSMDIYWKHHESHCLDFVKAYDGAKETLEHYGQKKKAVISNKPEIFSKKILEALNLAAHFDLILGGESLPERKPHPLPVLTVIAKLNADKASTVMIGDGRQDIDCGKAAGILTCGVTYGFRPRQDVAHADFVVDRLMDLKDLFN